MELTSFLYLHWGCSLHLKCEYVRITGGQGTCWVQVQFSELSIRAMGACPSSAGLLGDGTGCWLTS